MLYLNDKVVNLRAWQLYLGNAVYTFLAGLVLLILARILGFFGLDTSEMNNLIGKVGQLSGAAKNPLGNHNNEHMMDYNQQLM